jgi:hypothetical protein
VGGTLDVFGLDASGNVMKYTPNATITGSLEDLIAVSNTAGHKFAPGGTLTGQYYGQTTDQCTGRIVSTSISFTVLEATLTVKHVGPSIPIVIGGLNFTNNGVTPWCTPAATPPYPYNPTSIDDKTSHLFWYVWSTSITWPGGKPNMDVHEQHHRCWGSTTQRWVGIDNPYQPQAICTKLL